MQPVIVLKMKNKKKVIIPNWQIFDLHKTKQFFDFICRPHIVYLLTLPTTEHMVSFTRLPLV